MDSPEPASRRAVLTALGSASDRVPTRWFAGIGTAAFLIATAGFGGFADVPPAAVATLALGTPHTTEQMTLELQNVVVLDDIPELSLDVPPGERVVTVLAHATNEWTEPQSSTVALQDLLRLDVGGLAEERPTMIARVDDSLPNPQLQPGLRVPLAFVWTVPRELLSAGDEVTVELFDQTLRTGQVVADGRWWDDPVLAATVTAPVEDLDAGEAAP